MLNIILIFLLLFVLIYTNYYQQKIKEAFIAAAARAVANAARKAAEATARAVRAAAEAIARAIKNVFNKIINAIRNLINRLNIDPCRWISGVINGSKILWLVQKIIDFFQKTIPQIFNRYLISTINRMKNEVFININLFINNINNVSSHIILLINQIYQKTVFFAFNFFREVMQDPFNFGFFLITLPITKVWLMARTFIPFFPNYSFPNLIALFLFAFTFVNSFFVYLVFEYWYFTFIIVFFMIRLIISVLNRLP